MIEYQKIPGPWKRAADGPNRNKVIAGAWTSEDLAYLQDAPWLWTEKVDGTNIRIHWDGHHIAYGGRTENAQIPARLLAALDALKLEPLIEQHFGETEAILFGEGYGGKVQKGGLYRPDESFVLFDVLVGRWWLNRDGIRETAAALGIMPVPEIGSMTLNDAIDLWRSTGVRSAWDPTHVAEGMVGVTPTGLVGRSGHRLIVKVKAADFYPTAS